MSGPAGRTRSIRRTIVTGAVAFIGLLVLVFLGLAGANLSMRADLAEATTSFVEEQRIADRLLRAVTRQLVAASNFAGYQGERAMTDFRAAGDEAYEEIRRYLFRDLSPEQRMQLETVKEQHQRLEVTASQAFELFGESRTADAEASADAMVGHGLALQDAVDGFLRLREEDLDQISDRQAETFRYISAGVGLFALLLFGVTAIVARFLHRRLARPITTLVTAATAIGRGDLAARVDAPHNDEFAEVAQAFNRMADRLAVAKSSLEDRNHQLQGALDELKTAQAELVQSEKMSATGRMMAGLAHELNNPLASVLGYGELLTARLDDDTPPTIDELRTDFMDPIVSEAVRARGLVRNLLRFSRRSERRVSTVSLRDTLNIVVGLRRYAFEQAGLSLTVDAIPDCYVRAEPQRMQQVFLNIINNAFDAMRPAGHGALRVTAGEVEGTVVVSFDDTGPGFADPGRAFEPFYTTKAPGEGTGLGLSLVHRFMEGFGGRVRGKNRGEGGARIVLTFTAATPSGDQVHTGQPQEPTAVAPRSSVRILVVEDEMSLRNLQRRLLARIDADVLLASAGHEATRLLEDEDVDLVVSDVKMPGGSGLDLFRWVELNRPMLTDRFLFVTGDIGDPEIAALANAEPHRFIHKPFQMAEYIERVSAALA